MCPLHHRFQHQHGFQALIEHATGQRFDKYSAKDWFLDKAKYFDGVFKNKAR
jgi:hypothetical protein